jgi:hypothetical protein
VAYHTVWKGEACATFTRAEDEILLLAIFGIALLYAKPEILQERFAVWHARLAGGFVVVGVVAVVMIILDGLLEGIMFGHVDVAILGLKNASGTDE